MFFNNHIKTKDRLTEHYQELSMPMKTLLFCICSRLYTGQLEKIKFNCKFTIIILQLKNNRITYQVGEEEKRQEVKFQNQQRFQSLELDAKLQRLWNDQVYSCKDPYRSVLAKNHPNMK